MAVELIGPTAMNIVISHQDGVLGAVRTKAAEISDIARGNLASHRYSGNAKITVSHGDVDSFVNLVDPAAASIEFGHWVKGKYKNPDHPKFVPGLYIITRASGLASSPKQGPRRSRR